MAAEDKSKDEKQSLGTTQNAKIGLNRYDVL